MVGTFVDFVSGTRTDRPQYRLLIEAARRREADVVLVWRHDRFARLRTHNQNGTIAAREQVQRTT